MPYEFGESLRIFRIDLPGPIVVAVCCLGSQCHNHAIISFCHRTMCSPSTLQRARRSTHLSCRTFRCVSRTRELSRSASISFCKRDKRRLASRSMRTHRVRLRLIQPRQHLCNSTDASSRTLSSSISCQVVAVGTQTNVVPGRC